MKIDKKETKRVGVTVVRVPKAEKPKSKKAEKVKEQSFRDEIEYDDEIAKEIE